jgi:hypothetical protein
MSRARPCVTIRLGVQADGRALERLAHLDSMPPLRGRCLVAEVDGEIRAAMTTGDARAIADPFFRSLELVELLALRAAQLRGDGDDRNRRPLGRLVGWPRATRSTASRGASRPRSATA